MSRGIPTLGSGRTLSGAADELANDVPRPEVLGTVTGADLTKLTNPDPFAGVPPWEIQDGRRVTDARRYVKVPDDWHLRWLSPRMIDHVGTREWALVSPSDSRVSMIVPAMAKPDGTIRLGGRDGMILHYMPDRWVQSRRKAMAERHRKQTQSAVDRQQAVVERMRAREFGRYIQPDGPVMHPTHTQGEGQTMERE
jgi:hypothetical protein